MFSLANVKTRYFEFETPDGTVLHIEPPKLKTLNKLTAVAKDPDPTPEEMAEVIAKIISKTKEGRAVTADAVMDWMDSDQLGAFVEAFMGWLNGEKTADPN